jgi:hypothetical protein
MTVNDVNAMTTMQKTGKGFFGEAPYEKQKRGRRKEWKIYR